MIGQLGSDGCLSLTPATLDVALTLALHRSVHAVDLHVVAVGECAVARAHLVVRRAAEPGAPTAGARLSSASKGCCCADEEYRQEQGANHQTDSSYAFCGSMPANGLLLLCERVERARPVQALQRGPASFPFALATVVIAEAAVDVLFNTHLLPHLPAIGAEFAAGAGAIPRVLR
jgi:hypothetical protein